MKIKRLILENFRNFKSKQLNFSSNLVLLSGQNGVGKTNILEALTLFGKGQNLRGTDFEEMLILNHETKQQEVNFSTFCELENHDFIEKIGVSFDKISKKKITQINGENVTGKKSNDSKNYLPNFVWLTPQLELLLISGKSQRRDFLDKIVCDIDSSHNTRINSYQKELRERLLILQKKSDKNQETWLEIVENKISELGGAIALARFEAVDFFNKAIQSFESNFPKCQLKIIDELDLENSSFSAIQIEEIYKENLKKNRQFDKESFKTHFGVHRSDLSAIFLDKNSSANYASTGEQKSIMIGITLARAKISSQYKNQPTILIFDEIVSHLDKKKKENLLEEIEKTGIQCFFSATHKDLMPKTTKFEEISV
jgi:DNA replication and repair protein RecF